MKTFVAVLVLVAGVLAADKPAPKVSDADKLAIRNAQVEMLQAQAALTATQQKMLQAISEAYAHAGVTQAEWGMNDKLELVPATKPAPPTGVKAVPSPAPTTQPPK